MQKIEISEPESVSDSNGALIEEKVEIEEELLPPKQGSGDDSTEKAENDAASIKGSKAGWKIQWNPLSAREARLLAFDLICRWLRIHCIQEDQVERSMQLDAGTAEASDAWTSTTPAARLG